MKWAALLHDIAKLSTPVMAGKDHIHPFKSAKVVIDVFQKLGILKTSQFGAEEPKVIRMLDNVKRLINESV